MNNMDLLTFNVIPIKLPEAILKEVVFEIQCCAVYLCK